MLPNAAGYISIHSLRVEGDEGKYDDKPEGGISIHSLRVEGDAAIDALKKDQAFQSTPSVWRETDNINSFCYRRLISIHSLRVEGDAQTVH